MKERRGQRFAGRACKSNPVRGALAIPPLHA